MESFKKDKETSWCPGCGNFPLLDAYTSALEELGLARHQVAVISGIGQAAKIPHYMDCNGFQGLHGRALPVAFGVKATNPALTVLVNTGDGDGYGEGGNHFLHAIRRNIDITHIVHDNQIYGLTKGQGSPTTALGQITTMQLQGTTSRPFNPIATALAAGATFVARGFVSHKEHLKDLIKRAIAHPGYALIDVYQPCVTFNKVNTYAYYNAHTTFLPKEHDVRDLQAAMHLALEPADRIPLGVYYENPATQWQDGNLHVQDGLLDASIDLKKRQQVIRQKLFFR